MPIIVTYLNPNMRPDIIEGESWKKLDEDSPRLGTINLKSLADSHRIIVNKSAVAKVEEIPQATWDANTKAAEERATAEKQRTKRERDGVEKAALEARKLKNRIRRLFRRGGSGGGGHGMDGREGKCKDMKSSNV